MPRPGDAYFLIPFLNAYYLLPPPRGSRRSGSLAPLFTGLLAREKKKERKFFMEVGGE